MRFSVKNKKALIFISLCSLFMISNLLNERARGKEKTGFLSITGPCNLSFPGDHGPHPGYRTEWWYYTGNLKDASGNPYGFQLTFFRSQISPLNNDVSWPKPPSAWRAQHIYLGHAALSDMKGKRHLLAETMAREALGMAGALTNKNGFQVFIKNWSADVTPNMHQLKTHTADF